MIVPARAILHDGSYRWAEHVPGDWLVFCIPAELTVPMHPSEAAAFADIAIHAGVPAGRRDK